MAPVVTGCLGFMSAKPPACRVHKGPSDIKITFCLVKADAPALVKLLLENEGKPAGAAVHELATLVSGDDILSKESSVLYE